MKASGRCRPASSTSHDDRVISAEQGLRAPREVGWDVGRWVHGQYSARRGWPPCCALLTGSTPDDVRRERRSRCRAEGSRAPTSAVHARTVRASCRSRCASVRLQQIQPTAVRRRGATSGVAPGAAEGQWPHRPLRSSSSMARSSPRQPVAWSAPQLPMANTADAEAPRALIASTTSVTSWCRLPSRLIEGAENGNIRCWPGGSSSTTSPSGVPGCRRGGRFNAAADQSLAAPNRRRTCRCCT